MGQLFTYFTFPTALEIIEITNAEPSAPTIANIYFKENENQFAYQQPYHQQQYQQVQQESLQFAVTNENVTYQCSYGFTDHCVEMCEKNAQERQRFHEICQHSIEKEIKQKYTILNTNTFQYLLNNESKVNIEMFKTISSNDPYFLRMDGNNNSILLFCCGYGIVQNLALRYDIIEYILNCYLTVINKPLAIQLFDGSLFSILYLFLILNDYTDYSHSHLHSKMERIITLMCHFYTPCLLTIPINFVANIINIQKSSDSTKQKVHKQMNTTLTSQWKAFKNHMRIVTNTNNTMKDGISKKSYTTLIYPIKQIFQYNTQRSKLHHDTIRNYYNISLLEFASLQQFGHSIISVYPYIGSIPNVKPRCIQIDQLVGYYKIVNTNQINSQHIYYSKYQFHSIEFIEFYLHCNIIDFYFRDSCVLGNLVNYSSLIPWLSKTDKYGNTYFMQLLLKTFCTHQHTFSFLKNCHDLSAQLSHQNNDHKSGYDLVIEKHKQHLSILHLIVNYNQI